MRILCFKKCTCRGHWLCWFQRCAYPPMATFLKATQLGETHGNHWFNGCWNGSPKRWDRWLIIHPPIGRKNTTYIPLKKSLPNLGGEECYLPTYLPPFRGTISTTIDWLKVKKSSTLEIFHERFTWSENRGASWLTKMNWSWIMALGEPFVKRLGVGL